MGGSTRRTASRRQVWQYVTTGLTVLALLVVWYFQDRNTDDPTAASTGPQAPAAQGAADGTALAVLDGLTVLDDEPPSGYDRDLFGDPWADVDGNGCDTRNDILARDLTAVTYQDTKSCVVASGTLDDPYTGETIEFQRGKATSAAVQIDHVVALKNGWQTGADSWDADTRRRFANDPLNLLAADGPANQAKGAKDASQWLPANEAFGCEYVARQVAVKSAYDLSITSAEHDAMVDVLTGCPDEPLPH